MFSMGLLFILVSRPEKIWVKNNSLFSCGTWHDCGDYGGYGGYGTHSRFQSYMNKWGERERKRVRCSTRSRIGKYKGWELEHFRVEEQRPCECVWHGNRIVNAICVTITDAKMRCGRISGPISILVQRRQRSNNKTWKLYVSPYIFLKKALHGQFHVTYSKWHNWTSSGSIEGRKKLIPIPENKKQSTNSSIQLKCNLSRYHK